MVISPKDVWTRFVTNYKSILALAAHTAPLKKSFAPQMPDPAPDVLPGPSLLPCLLQVVAWAAWSKQLSQLELSCSTFASHYFHFSNFSATEHHQLCTRITEPWLSSVTYRPIMSVNNLNTCVPCFF